MSGTRKEIRFVESEFWDKRSLNGDTTSRTMDLRFMCGEPCTAACCLRPMSSVTKWYNLVLEKDGDALRL